MVPGVVVQNGQIFDRAATDLFRVPQRIRTDDHRDFFKCGDGFGYLIKMLSSLVLLSVQDHQRDF